MAKQKHLLPILALILANILYGINIPMIKLGLETIPVTIFMSVKFLTASLILLPFALKTWKPLKRRELMLMILSSLFFITFTALAINIGLQYAPSINWGVISILSPLVLCILSVEFLKEHVSLKAFIGTLIAFGGAAVIIGKPWEAALSDQSVLLGNVLFIAAMLGGVISTLIAKPILKKMSSYQAAFIYVFVGILPIAAFSITQFKGWDIHEVSTSSYIAVIYGIVAVTLANFLHIYGLRYKAAHSVGIFHYIEPIVIIIAAWFILGEHPSLKFAVGAILVFIGIYLAEIRLPQKLILHYHKR